jgi:hypothetical protein
MCHSAVNVLSAFLTRAMTLPDATYTLDEVKSYLAAVQDYMNAHPMEKGRMAEALGRVALRELNARMGGDVKTMKALHLAAYPRANTIPGNVPGAHGPGDGPATSGPSSTSGARDYPPKH